MYKTFSSDAMEDDAYTSGGFWFSLKNPGNYAKNWIFGSNEDEHSYEDTQSWQVS